MTEGRDWNAVVTEGRDWNAVTTEGKDWNAVTTEGKDWNAVTTEGKTWHRHGAALDIALARWPGALFRPPGQFGPVHFIFHWPVWAT